jgi:hypothetical protein
MPYDSSDVVSSNKPLGFWMLDMVTKMDANTLHPYNTARPDEQRPLWKDGFIICVSLANLY